MKKLIPVFLFIVVLTACGGAAGTEDHQVSDTSPVVVETETASPSATFTPSPTPTSSPTPTPSPTVTATPTITFTPTPEGFYQNFSAALSLIIPEDWEIVQEDSSGVIFSNEDLFLTFFALSELSDGETSIDDVVAEYLGELGDDASLVEVDEVTLGDSITAPRAKINVDSQGTEVGFHLVYLDEGKRAYSFITIGPEVSFVLNTRVIDGIYKSVSLLTGQVYGLDKDKTLVLMGYDPKPEQLDPAISESPPSGYLGLLYSGLVRLSPQLQIQPDLAEKWEVSADGTVYTFTLRQGITFQDGRPITAHDIKYSLERAADPDNNSPTASTYLGDILGLKARLDGEAEEIEGVRVIDDVTVEITLDGPKSYFLAKFAYTPSLVVDREAIESSPEDWMFRPNASGPFKLLNLIEEDAVIFERNERYHTPAGVQFVVYLLYKPGPRIGYFEAGEIDLTALSKTEALRVLEEDDPLHDQLSTTASLCSTMVKLNNTLQPMDDINFRKALALSIDRDHLLELFYENLDLRGMTILPPGMPGFSADLSADEFNPGEARKALDQSVYAGEEITLTMIEMGYGDSESPFENALIDMWREHLGIEVEIQYIDPLDFSNEARETEAHLVNYGWCADYPDPENYLDVLFHSEGHYNSVNYANPELDALLEGARIELDPERRLSLYHQAERLLLEDYAVIPIRHGVSFFLINPRVQGFYHSPLGVASYIHLLSISPGE